MQRYSFVAIGFSVVSACASGELPARSAHDPANPSAAEAPIAVQAMVPERPTPSVEASDAGARVYSCPMHPEVRQATPGTCPKCDMQLRPKDGT